MRAPNKDVVRELRIISDQNGGLLNPVLVVERARHPESPLHSQFEWDDSKAAAEHRLEQARRLIRVCVTVISGSSEPERIWVSLESDRHSEGGYRPLVQILSNKEMREELLIQAKADCDYFVRKYNRLKELSKIIMEMKKIRKR